MKNKLYDAWTMIELVVCLIVIIILSSFLIREFKPMPLKSKIFLYATVRNIDKANAYIVDNNKTLLSADPDVDNKDQYCVHFADSLSLAQPADCDTSFNRDNKANIVFPNGVTLYGLTSKWHVPYTDCEWSYKNIMIDVDGPKGQNKLWVDRFPFRIFDNSPFSGMIFPVNCGTSDVIYDTEGNIAPIPAGDINPFCSGNKDFQNDDKYITYDIYRPNSLDLPEDAPEGQGVKSYIRKGLLSPQQADCEAYGGRGMLTKYRCSALHIRVMDVCVTDQLCEDCLDTATGVDICPIFDGAPLSGMECKAKRAEVNPNDLACFAILHKPSGGVNIMLNTALDEIDL